MRKYERVRKYERMRRRQTERDRQTEIERERKRRQRETKRNKKEGSKNGPETPRACVTLSVRLSKTTMEPGCRFSRNFPNMAVKSA